MATFLLCLGLGPWIPNTANSAGQDSDIPELLQKLADDVPEIRERVRLRLEDLGEAALPALRRLAETGQREAQAAAKELLRRLELRKEGSLGLSRGTEGRTGVFDAPGAPKLPTLLWLYEYDNGLYACPTVAGDDLYFGEVGLSSLSLGGAYRFNCLDRHSGKVRWSVRHEGTAFYTSPAVSKDYVCIGGARQVFLYERATGIRRWDFDTGGLVLSSPLISAGRVLFGSQSGFFYALDLENGAVRWKFNAGAPIGEAAAVAAGRVYVRSGDSVLHALDLGSGREIWKVKADQRLRAPVVSDGRVLVSGEANRLQAYDAATGTSLWDFGEEPWELPFGPDHLGDPATDAGRVYVISPHKAVYAVDARTGKQLWSYVHHLHIQEPPILAGGLLYCLSNFGDLFALDARTGNECWVRKMGMANRGPVIAGDTLYIADRRGKVVYALR